MNLDLLDQAAGILPVTDTVADGREIKLYDPDRRPANWTDVMSDAQYAVFHVDVWTGALRKTDGEQPDSEAAGSCLIFDSLNQAKSYAVKKTLALPDLACEIYDHEGKSKPPLEVIVNPAHRKKFAGLSPEREALWGCALIAVCFLILGLDLIVLREWILGLVIGSKPFIAGMTRLISGATRMIEAKKQSLRESNLNGS